VQLPEHWDPEAPGSRFTRRPAIAITSRRGDRSIYDQDEADTGDARRVILETIDEEFLRDDSVLGEPRILDGSQGRGGAAWVPVIEWLANAGGQGAVGLGVSLALLRIGRRLRDVLARLRGADVSVLVSRGVAEALAVEDVVRRGLESEGAVDMESAVEAAFIGGGASPELNYVGADPWIVSLVIADRTKRYIVGVAPDGQIEGVIVLPISDTQRAYLPLPPRVSDEA
jgi:hypothetical protein